MHSRDVRAAAVLLGAAVLFALIGIGAAVNRSLIPRSVEATVDRVEVRREKRPGVDDVWLIHLDGRPVHVDRATAERLSQGQRLRKGAWDTQLTADDERIELALSADARAMLAVMTLTVGAAMVAAGPFGPIRRWTSSQGTSTRDQHDAAPDAGFPAGE